MLLTTFGPDLTIRGGDTDDIDSVSEMRVMDSNDQEKLNILVVDDDSASRELMGALLSDYGQCSNATNGADAVKAVTKSLDDKTPFDLICLDIMMPEMDGLEALKLIRELEQEAGIAEPDRAKVLMTTTASQVSKTMKAFHHGCSGYLVKPISKDAIAKEISKLPLARSFNTRWSGR
jgi:two-component system chemotaxis response regulator CheY